MNRIKFSAGLLLIVLAGFANANDNAYYYGATVGIVSPQKIHGYDTATSRSYKLEEITSAGLLAGYKLDENLFIEGDITTNVQGGKIGDYAGDSNLEWNMNTVSLHGIYRGSGKYHIRIKVGLTHIALSDTGNLSNNVWYPDASSTNFTYGIGMGLGTSSGKEFFVEWAPISDDFHSLMFGLIF